jgi:putative multiple sugar transport system substrate-binding protein
MRKRKLLSGLAAVAAASALALTGCGRDSGSGSGSGSGSDSGFSKDAKIGVSLPQKTSENWVLAENLFNKDLKSAGFKPKVQFANNGASEQQNQIDAMITSGVKVLIVGAVDGKQLGSQLQRAHDEGITVIAYDRMLTNSKNVDYYIAYDNYKVGELQGEALLKGLKERKGNGPYNIELVAGSPDDANATPFFKGAMSKLTPKIKDGTLKVLSGQTTFSKVATQGWDPKNVQSRMDTILSAKYGSKSLDGVLSPNDTLARAAMLSAKNAGQKTPVVTGQDSEVESLKSILAGQQYSTINKDTTNLVKQSVKMIKDLQKGKKISEATDKTNNEVKDVPTEYLDPVLVTKENIKTAYKNDPSLNKIVNP